MHPPGIIIEGTGKSIQHILSDRVRHIISTGFVYRDYDSYNADNSKKNEIPVPKN